MADKTTGKQILTASRELLKQDKEIAALPVLSVIAGLIAASIVGGISMIALSATPAPAGAVSAIAAFLFLYSATATSVFFQTAVVAGAIARINGEDPTVKTCLAAAKTRLPQILAWSLLSATVGFIINQIAERLPAIGQIIVRVVFGSAWAIITFFAVPVIAAEGTGPKEAFARSKDIISTKWGTALRTNLRAAGQQVVTLIPFLAIIGVGVAKLFSDLGDSGTGAVGASSVALVAVGLIGLIVVVQYWAAIMSYSRAVLYMHATGHAIPGIDKAVLDNAFEPKRSLF